MNTPPHKQQQAGPGIIQVAMQFNVPISCMAWRRDGQQLAIAAHGSNDVEVWQNCQTTTGTAWSQIAVLRGHTMPVSGLDWNNMENMLVSCSHDRSAFIWHESTNSPGYDSSLLPGSSWTVASPGWHRQLVETRLKRGCTCVHWSPFDKHEMAVGSAGRALTVLSYDQQMGYWCSRQVPRAASTSVTCIAWHPQLRLIAAGSTDNCIRLFSTATAGPQPAHNQLPNAKFGQLLCVVAPSPTAGWLHAVAWTCNGSQLLCSSHNSQLLVCDLEDMLAAMSGARNTTDSTAAQASESALDTTIQPSALLQLPGCPLKTLTVLNDTIAVGGGWDGVLLLFTCHKAPGASTGVWQLQYLLGRFLPGERPPMSPAYMAPGSTLKASGGRMSQQGLNQQLRSMSISSQGHDNDHSLGAWEDVLEGTTPAHEACVTMLAPIPQPGDDAHDDIHTSHQAQPDQGHGSSPLPAECLRTPGGRKPPGSWGVQPVAGHRSNSDCSAVHVSSCGLDGKMIMWQLPVP